jgi:hypothetical protein
MRYVNIRIHFITKLKERKRNKGTNEKDMIFFHSQQSTKLEENISLC